MKQKYLGLGALLIVGLIVFFWVTKPSVKPEDEKPLPERGDPLTVPLLLHMMEAESLKVGDDRDADIRIQQSGNEVMVRVNPRLALKLGEGGLESLGLLEMEEAMSWNRYLDFLQDLHDKIAVGHSNSAYEHEDMELERQDAAHLGHE